MANIQSGAWTLGSYKAYVYLRYNLTSETDTVVTYNVKRGILLEGGVSAGIHWDTMIGYETGQIVHTYSSRNFRGNDLSGQFFWISDNTYHFSKTTSVQTQNYCVGISSLVREDRSSLPATREFYRKPETAEPYGTDIYCTLTIPALAQYTVTFNANGHGTAPAPQTIYYGYKASEPTAPRAIGYDFIGWYTDTNYTTKWDFNTMNITNNIILYARWSVHTYHIKYNPNGGTGNVLTQNKSYTASVNLYTQSSANYNKITQTVGAPTIKHSISTWNTQTNGNGTSYALNQRLGNGALTNDLYLFAIWQPQYIYPTISNVNVIRTNSSSSTDITEYDDGEYLYITFNWTGYSTNGQNTSPTYVKPTCIITVDGTYTYNPTLSGTASANNVSFSYKITTQSFSRDLSHSISIELFNPNDTTQRADATITVATAILPIDLYGSGSNVYMGIMHPYVAGQVITIPNLYIDTTDTTTIDNAIRTAITNLGWSDVLT